MEHIPRLWRPDRRDQCEHPDHVLSLRRLSEHYCGRPLECCNCEDVIHNGSEYYACDECFFFYSVHKQPCAEPPPLIQHHPSHPQHPLSLHMSLQDVSNCGLCRTFQLEKDWFYRCRSCSNFNVHADCAVATLPVKEDEVDSITFHHMEHIHKHPLSALVVKFKRKFRCRGCDDFIFGEAYICYECGIFFHKACVNAPREIQRHPFHPQHSLELIFDGSKLSYSCKECGILPFNMSTLISTLPHKDEDDVREEENRSAIDHIAHEHPLRSYHAATEIKDLCKECLEPIVDGFYGCIDCRFLIHELCAKLPSEIQHYLHTNHPLSLIREVKRDQGCGNCDRSISRSLLYSCKASCDFALHGYCALKTLVYLEKGALGTIQHFSHKHELTLYHKFRTSYSCYACHKSTDAPQYHCRTKDCVFSIHKSCVELPSIIEPTFHPHPLIFHHEESDNRPPCSACEAECGPFMFSCTECELNFDVDCALLERPTLKGPHHKHDLIYVARFWTEVRCKVCGKRCRVDAFRCWKCKINFHSDCANLLSKTIVSKFHVDPLTLNESVIEDDWGEYYCDICEGIRDPKLWVYYCAECEFIAHVKCATSLVRLKPVKENPELEQLNKEIECVSQQKEAMDKKWWERKRSLRALGEQLQELNNKLAEALYCGVELLWHPMHSEHALYLRELSQHYYDDPLQCQRCKGDIYYGSVYCCEKCYFFLHNPCAEAPTEMQHHPCHPQHPLTLQIGYQYSHCYLCKGDFSYKECCYKCKCLVMHTYCAVATFPNNVDKEDSTALQHVEHIHEHPLSSIVVKLRDKFSCRGCGHWIFGEASICYECGIFFHKVCVDAPREVQHHPFHSQHTLELIFDCSELKYSCKECGVLPFDILTLISTLSQKEEDDVREEESLSAIHHFAHEHPLNSYHATTKIKHDCQVCSGNIVNGFYGCIGCLFLIHKSCAKVPSEIHHYLHTNYPLSLIPKPEDCYHKCQSCQKFIWGDAYHCKACNFALHKECALKSLAYLEEEATVTIQHFSQQRALTLHHLDLGQCCYECEQRIKGLGYGCQMGGRQFFIHKSCLDPPPFFQQSFHPHPLILHCEESDSQPHCSACVWQSDGFMLSCAECKLNLHLKCAFLERPTLKKDRLHKHDLIYVVKHWDESSCRVCGKQCRVDLFRCWECGIQVHYDCAHLLLKTIVSDFHVDPLTLHESIIEDDSGEHYCDICEGKRDPELWVYHCAECKLFAHVKCATSRVRLDFKKQKVLYRQLEKEIGRVKSLVDAKEVEMAESRSSAETLREKWYALTGKRGQLMYQS